MGFWDNPVLRGAVKSGVASASSLIVALPVTDPVKFSIASVGGWEHIVAVIFFVVVVGEARYWNAWANNGNGSH